MSSQLTAIENLIAPIEDSHQGVGEDLTFDPRLDAISNARIEDDPLLSQGDWVTDLKVADWDFVKAECETLLTGTSKDLKVALWYVDALSHTHHLTGINHGLVLLQALNDTYWLTMYPPLDGEDDSMDIRAGLYAWFVKTLSENLKQLPLADTAHGSYTYNHFLSAREHDKQRQQDEDNGHSQDRLSIAEYNQAISLSDTTWQAELQHKLSDLATHWQTLIEQLDDLMGMDAPVFASVTDLIETLQQHLEPLLPSLSEQPTQPVENGEELTATDTTTSAQPQMNAGISTSFSPNAQSHQANRQQALKLLAQIQDYFAKNEPHSPVTYLLARAIKWADMPLDEWLAHLIKSPDQLESLADIIGIETPKQDDSY